MYAHISLKHRWWEANKTNNIWEIFRLENMENHPTNTIRRRSYWNAKTNGRKARTSTTISARVILGYTAYVHRCRTVAYIPYSFVYNILCPVHHGLFICRQKRRKDRRTCIISPSSSILVLYVCQRNTQNASVPVRIGKKIFAMEIKLII